MRIEGDHRQIRPVDNGDEAVRQDRPKDRGQVRHHDAVEISDGARLLHAEATRRVTGSNPTDEAEKTLSRVITRVRERIRSGFYDSDEVTRGIAGRIIDLRDL